MIKIHTKYVHDKKGKPLEVVLPVKEFKALLEYVEEIEDSLDLEKAIEEAKEFVPWEEFKKELQGGKTF
ncbi:MAG TPA: hypothetical protein ACFYD2_01665 [Candidatus Avalokitesvara rifleensis]|uniref:hypothetical protein n=1 Tax=Candidatus Avalokitesvara rifleensis TaxID=3367620 RepID=UPI0027123168|nr:hypothetical protein [Candidatus Brocadiales bacterium]